MVTILGKQGLACATVSKENNLHVIFLLELRVSCSQTRDIAFVLCGTRDMLQQIRGTFTRTQSVFSVVIWVTDDWLSKPQRCIHTSSA